MVFPSLFDNVAQFPRNINVAILTEDSGPTLLTLKLETKTGTLIGKLDSLSPVKARLEPNDSSISFTETRDSAHSLYVADFLTDTLQEGTYDLEASFRGKNEKHPFSYVWLDKPLALGDFATALSLLKYIVPDSVFSLINSGNDQERREKFDEYWKSHDPTPKTAFNELEAEFYGRADYAFDHFRSVGTNNGAQTDRGKAYIIFGKPADIRREFRSDGTYEIWYYPNQKKSLIFREQGFGEFRLYRTENL
jgi:GWxTD domain-containing protein